MFTLDECKLQDVLYVKCEESFKERTSILRGLVSLSKVDFNIPVSLMEEHLLETVCSNANIELDLFDPTVTEARVKLNSKLSSATKNVRIYLRKYLLAIIPSPKAILSQEGHKNLLLVIEALNKKIVREPYTSKRGLFLDFSSQMDTLVSTLEGIKVSGSCIQDVLGISLVVKDDVCEITHSTQLGVTETHKKELSWNLEYVRSGLDIPSEQYKDIIALIGNLGTVSFLRHNSILNALEAILPSIQSHNLALFNYNSMGRDP